MTNSSTSKEATDQVIVEIENYIKSTAQELHHYIFNEHYERLIYTARDLERTINKSDRILDIGSFPYFLPAYLSLKGFNNIISMDIPRVDDFPLSEAWNFKTLPIDIEDALIPLEDSSLDVVLLLEVFEHLYHRPNQVFREIRRVLKPGGRLIISTPNGAKLSAYAKAIFKKQFGTKIYEWSDVYEKYGYFAHIREYSLQEIEEYLVNFDFCVEKASRLSFFQLDNPHADGAKKLIYSAYRVAAPILHFVPFMQNNIYLIAKNLKAPE
jgi:SAM-dependent methyltransferase